MPKGHTCIYFKSPPPNTNYTAGTYSWVLDELAQQYIDDGYGSEYDPGKKRTVVDSVDTDLPEDLPGREHLIKAGIRWMADLEKMQDFEWIDGIGKSTEKKLKEWLEGT